MARPNFLANLRHAWNAFTAEDDQPARPGPWNLGAASSTRSDRVRYRWSTEKSIIASIYTRLAIDIASTPIRHVRVDSEGNYLEDINSNLNNCFKIEANIDQAAQQFRIDLAMSLLEEGTTCIVPVDTTLNPNVTGAYDILTMRVGKVVQWYPRHVRVEVYNDAPKKGIREQILLEKTMVAIVENPLYPVMNEPNSTLQRLIKTLNRLDAVDDASASGQLDVIIQLPYTIKSEARRQQAEQRLADIEFQLRSSKHGIAYADATEKITQLNRPVENNMMDRVTYLTEMLYGQLGLTANVLNGTALEAEMNNYYNRTIKVILKAVCEAMARVFLTKTARSQGQSIEFYIDPFKFVPLSLLADLIDKTSRNEIMTANDWRSALGIKPSKDPKADKLQNSNMPIQPSPAESQDSSEEGDSQNGT